MKCIHCNTPLAGIDYCPGCGADVTLLKRIGRISNLLYNRGLEKAQVRDLSGAIELLKQSLKFNKENIDARNLLGLCYYETGEMVSALCEWVISNNMSSQNNPAERYIKDLQENKNQLDNINQTIKKYNQSIEYCRQDQEDMAIMQLKKVIAQNPKLVKGHQLLALLYMKHQEYEKARRILKKAAAIDNTNTRTLRYLTEIEEVTGKSGRGKSRRRHEVESEGYGSGPLHYISGNETIIQPTTFRDSSTVATFINIGLGILLGGAIVWFMAVPATKQKIQQEANSRVTDANLQLATGNAQAQDLQSQIDDYQKQVDDANAEKDKALSKADGYDQLLGAANSFVNGQQDAAVEALDQIDGEQLEDNAKALYDTLKSSVGDTLFNQNYSAGTTAYVQGDYATAATALKAAVEADAEGTNVNYSQALMYLAFAYYNQGDKANANTYFKMLVEKFPSYESQVAGYITANADSAGTSDTGAATQGEASLQNDQTGQSAGGDQTSQSTGGDVITVYGDGTTDNKTPSFDPSLVAWTDPNTGLHYDVSGNLLG